MSVVIGIKTDGKVYIGADSCTTNSGMKFIDKHQLNNKIVKFSNGLIIGHTGRRRTFDVVKTMNIQFNGVLDHKYLVRYFIPKLLDELKTFGYLDEDEHFEQIESRFIVAYQDKMFVIASDTSVREVDDFATIGSGESEAFGSVYTTKEENPEIIIRDAIKATSMHDECVSMPAIIMNTSSDDVKIYE